MPDALDTEAIRARLEAATPGPWDAVMPSDGGPHRIYGIDGGSSRLTPVDERFIAHAPTDVGALLDEVERLQAGGCARNQMTTQYCAEAADAHSKIAGLRFEIKRFRWQVARCLQHFVSRTTAIEMLDIVRELNAYAPPAADQPQETDG